LTAGPPPGPSLPPGIRYHAVMEGVQEHPNNGNTCCEGQGTRLFGSMPEYHHRDMIVTIRTVLDNID
jgi:hypothetical protein